MVYSIQGKEVACNISRLPPGSVVFEDIGTQAFKGQVLKPLERSNPARHTNDPLPGRIRYRAADHSEVEVPFGDKDQVSNSPHNITKRLFGYLLFFAQLTKNIFFSINRN